MRFYADENFPLPVVAELRRLGHDVVTAFEDGRANRGIDDEAVLKRATTLDRIVLTMNRVDFLRLHNSGYEHTVLSCAPSTLISADKRTRSIDCAHLLKLWLDRSSE
ncbi:MAG TPA: DUF5615 family PIN-like protein [Pyrinomonadaceae bacterium]|nr:DUF5615 family PIN-like protein [Pyrinomonadaceae bacterium]